MNFERLAKDIESFSFDRNSDFFHSLVKEMLTFLDFKFKENWYEIDVMGKSTPIIFRRSKRKRA